MSRLLKNQENLGQIIKAQTFFQRLRGLTAFKNLSGEELFWIPYCQSIHTFFMSFPLDLIFTDGKFQIVKTFKEIPANRIVFGGFKSRHVFEAVGGFLLKKKLERGDQLYVES